MLLEKGSAGKYLKRPYIPILEWSQNEVCFKVKYPQAKVIKNMSHQKLYHEAIFDHYRHPRNRGSTEKPDFCAEIFNPLCGDQVSLTGSLENGRITDCKFEGKGCVISLAAASMLTEHVTGRLCAEVMKFQKDVMLDLVKLELGPTRLRCALLALEALQKGLQQCCTEQSC